MKKRINKSLAWLIIICMVSSMFPTAGIASSYSDVEQQLSTGGSSNSGNSGGGSKITKAEFIAKISDYFAWPHPTDYNDIWKAPLKQFNDVKTSDTYGKQIEVAYEENIISPDASGNFNPESKISRQDAAVIFAKAFKIADSDKMVKFKDSTSISKEAIKSVNALVELGYMSGKNSTLFGPKDHITNTEVNSIFNKITSTTVAPVQALPKQTVEPYTAPRRYIKLYDPTPGATIYFTKAIATDLATMVEPAMPDINNPNQIYTVADDGHIKEDYTKNVDTYVQYKAVAVKDGMAISPVQTFTWHLYRPASADFETVLLQEKTPTSPAIYEIYNDSESVRAMAWYIEGQDKGIVFDALQTSISVKNLKDFVDTNLAEKPYSLIIGHTHGDHDAQLMNFLNAGVDVYVNQLGWSSLFGSLVKNADDQAKIKNIEEGDVIDLGGGVKFDVFAMPGHQDANIVLQDKANGLIFASDIYGCTRAGSADNVNVAGLRVDLLLSFAQQTYSNYQKDGGKTTSLFTGHDEYALNDSNIKLFEAALQQVIDKGEAGCSPTLRGGNNAPYSRTTLIGDMWKDGTNWISLQLAGIMGDNTEYLSSTTDISKLPYMADNSINYNGTDGFMKYSVLSNIEIEGGELLGKTVAWAPSKTFSWAGEVITVDTALQNRFNPWNYDYTINVPESSESITISPTTMSTKVKSIKLNGEEIGYRSTNNVPVSDGTVITISIIAPDNITTSTYSFTVKKETVTKAEFIAKISDYFAWPHPTEYNDIWKAPLKQFNDVETSDTYGKQIEVAYEENIISPDALGNFNPENKISRQDAAVIFAKAFKIADSDKMVEFSDSTSISEDAIKSVNALVELGYMSGKSSTLFGPNDLITNTEVNSIFNKITSTTVAPVQALPKQSIEYTAPRRYIKLYDPTPGATIYFTKAIATDLASMVEPAMPDITNPNQIYTVADDGHIKEDYTKNEHTYVMYKAIAVKDGMVISPVQTFTWHLYRPLNAEFEHKLFLAKTDTSPAVYQLYNDSESVRAMAWYIEGQEKGILFDALQTNIDVRNLKEYIDNNIASKPYSVIIGHNHPDHIVQAPNFIKEHDVYVNERGLSGLSSRFPNLVDQAKIKNIDEGDVFDIGGSLLNVYAIPGHANDNIILQDKVNGLIFSSDIYGCTRAGSADNVAVSGLRVDLLLSFAQQTYSNYQKDGGKTSSLFTGHDEFALNDSNIKLFEAALQQVIDRGEAGCSPTLRGGNNAPYSRTTLIGDMWKDGTNWISLLLAGKMGDDTEYLSSTTDISKLPYMADNSINYNGTDGFMKYSVLSNIEIVGGELVGKTVEWAPSKTFSWAGEEITVDTALQNRFNPWSYDYTINVPESNESIKIIPTTMSTKVKSIKLNGKEIGYRSSNNIPVSDGTVITISIIAPDNITTSTYSFTVKKGTVERLIAVNLDDVAAPIVDFTKANKLPITGYFEKKFDIGGLTRTAKIYIPEDTPVRAYFTVIAVPNNVDTEEFLVESGWKKLADEKAEGLFILEASSEVWGGFEEEQSYLSAAINFLSANNRFSIFGEHYFVGYGSGAPVLEAWAAANPLKVISQVYVNSEALTSDYLNKFSTMEFGGANGSYGVIEFPDGFEKIKYNEVVLPTWYINPESGYSDSLDYWKNSNDCVDSSIGDGTFGTIYKQSEESDRWMTSYSGPISEVAVLNDVGFDIMNSDDTNNIYDFLSYYTRYENAVAYGNQLSVRADYAELGIEVKTMTVLDELREYMIYVPDSAQEKWGDAAPVVVVLPGNSQTDKVFLDATQWWQVAEDEGFVLAIVCEQNNVSAPTTVSHKNTNQFYKQLREVIVNEYDTDPNRIYATGQSAGSNLSQSFAVAIPEYFAAIASTSGAAVPSAGTITIDGVSYNASNKMIPNYFMYGAGDITSMTGDLWDATQNSLDSWAAYHLGVNDFELADSSDYTSSGWMDRFKTWTWSKNVETIDIPFVKITQNLYRSHNCISEEMPMLWDFLKHYSYEVDENNNVTRYYSPSGFKNLADVVQIFKDEPNLTITDFTALTAVDLVDDDHLVVDLEEKLPTAVEVTTEVEVNLTITDFTALTAVDLDVDEHLLDLEELIASGKLPTTVEVTTDGTTTMTADITGWTGVFDGTTTGTYTLTAVWTMPAGYSDATTPIDIQETVNVIMVQTLKM